MKRFFALLAALAGTAVALGTLVGADAPRQPEKLLRHVVLFKFKQDAKPADIQKVVDAFAALPKQIPTIVDFEWGTDVGVENLSQGFTHCFFVTFRSAKDRDDYLPHPAHEKFKQLVGPVLEKPLVVDYWATR